MDADADADADVDVTCFSGGIVRVGLVLYGVWSTADFAAVAKLAADIPLNIFSEKITLSTRAITIRPQDFHSSFDLPSAKLAWIRPRYQTPAGINSCSLVGIRVVSTSHRLSVVFDNGHWWLVAFLYQGWLA